MIIGALWVLDQEQKFYERNFGAPTKHESELQSMALSFAALQTGLISGTPYRGMIKLVGGYDEFLRQVALDKKWYNPSGFSLKSIGGKLGFIPKYAKHKGSKIMLAKIGARFIPYVGWTLLATDVYFSAKWIHKNWYV